MRLDLIPLSAGEAPRLAIDWNEETGEIRGAGASFLEAFLDSLVAAGEIPCRPIPSAIEATVGIRKDPEQMAAAIAVLWRLPRELEGRYPAFEEGPGNAVF